MRVVTLLTDYGLRDEFVGVCHAVIAGACPAARIIDVTHGIPRHDVSVGAVTMARTLPYLPVGVHMAVVDPGVGGERRAVALRLADGRLLVGPDNGLLWPSTRVGGGVEQAVDISRSRWRLEPVSATFHGRDIFAPVAAALACGQPLDDAGEPLDPATLTTLEPPPARIADRELTAVVVSVDGFGNVALAAGADELAQLAVPVGATLQLTGPAAGPFEVLVARTFGDAAAGRPVLHLDSWGHLSLAINEASAAELFGVRAGDQLRFSA